MMERIVNYEMVTRRSTSAQLTWTAFYIFTLPFTDKLISYALVLAKTT
jgi:hypothetical protein